jgi:hypothetical protein
VVFDEPAADAPKIRPGSKLPLSGTISGLPPGHQMWIVSRSFSGGAYFVIEGEPQAFGDGGWETIDNGVGADDDYDGALRFTAVDADATCSRILAATAIPDDHRLTLAADVPRDEHDKEWPAACKKLSPSVAVHFISKPR